MFPILSVMTYIPLLGMIIILALPRNNPNLVRWVAVGVTAIPLALGVYLYLSFDRSTASMQFVEQFDYMFY